MSDENENDPESITFIGYRNSPPMAIEIDFGDRIFLVEFFDRSDVTFITVNAVSDSDAITKAVDRMFAEGRNPYKFEACRVSELERISDGNPELAAGDRPDV